MYSSRHNASQARWQYREYVIAMSKMKQGVMLINKDFKQFFMIEYLYIHHNIRDISVI